MKRSRYAIASAITAAAVAVCGVFGGAAVGNTVLPAEGNFVYAAEGAVFDRDAIPLDEKGADALAKKGYFKGTGSGYELDRNVKRSEAITMIVRLLDKEQEALLSSAGSGFDDVKAGIHWSACYVGYAKRNGLIEGVGDGKFEPNRNVTGREFMKTILSSLGFENVTLENAYEMAVKKGVITTDYAKIVVDKNVVLTRSDIVRICIESLKYKGVEIGSTAAVTTAAAFSDKVDAYMPSDKNYMFSPFSLKAALMMAANGASGSTQSQILEAAGVSDINEFNKQMRSMIDKYAETDILALSINNSIWLNESRTDQRFSNNFANLLKKYYDAESGIVNNENAVAEVNKWVKESTKDKIDSIVDDNEFWALLVNAVYFKARWQNEFDAEATEKAEFTSRDGSKKDIDFMNRTGWMNYSDTGNVKIVEMPYLNHEFKIDENGVEDFKRYDDLNVSMFIMLGDTEISNAETVLKNAEFDSQFTALSIPKFRIESDYEMKDMLKAIGITDAFSEDNADFKSMFTSDNMSITDVIQKTYINVDEKGTEAAAVTAVGMAGTALPPEPVSFTVDKPFTYIIRDNTNGEVLFMGQYAFAE